MKHIIALAVAGVLAAGLSGCTAEPGSDTKETKAADIKVDIPKEKQDEVAAKFKAGNFSKK